VALKVFFCQSLEKNSAGRPFARDLYSCLILVKDVASDA